VSEPVTLESALLTAEHYRKLFARLKGDVDGLLQREVVTLADEVLRLRALVATAESHVCARTDDYACRHNVKARECKICSFPRPSAEPSVPTIAVTSDRLVILDVLAGVAWQSLAPDARAVMDDMLADARGRISLVNGEQSHDAAKIERENLS
jgi:hypothetical protein